ncbi:ribonuclease R [Iodidimonas muriae]|uniref:Ribonuclease R n=1 Tax=Iodidimonas muriae TaxID=261467 RepID=A0ABQ2LEW9_9PROT|nr:ribonuclease R [Iodidimonas muriae]GER07661.1 ribonuclease R [Kordiimonadales bacterium JCM 17843]GGO14564.1 ribonuclease R [Iodidimonas muriae]
MSKAPTDRKSTLPSKADILQFLESSDEKITKREIARAFSVKGSDRIELKHRLREMVEDGVIERDSSKTLRPAGRLPSVTVVDITGPDAFGDVLARPANWHSDAPAPKIYLSDGKMRGKTKALGRGDRALVRLTLLEDQQSYSASIIKVLEGSTKQMLGVFHGSDLGGRVVPIDKKARDELLIDQGDVAGALDGELVTADLLPRRHNQQRGLKPARIVERHGDVSQTKQISLIAIHQYDLPTEFSEEALAEARAARPAPFDGREDLRAISLITIDPADARDHDDAVFAEPDTDPANPGGWHVIVAIADVAYYVRPNSALDRDARLRGNSAYFPDRVVPMLPEELSTDLCSLRPGEDRPCMAVHMWFDAHGQKQRHRFVRGVMRSAANISYEEVQGAMDGNPSSKAAPLLDPVLKPLYAAHDAITEARTERSPLEIQSDEKKILLDKDGEIAEIVPRVPLRAHRVIEDLMVWANVCAAETLEQKRMACMYRVHEEPAMDKVEALRDFLGTLDYKLARSQILSPRMFNKVLEKFRDTPHAILINQVVLRSQTQAYYSPENKGHFGLALTRYAHFTSPIRRYADLLVHRGLIRALGFGDDGLLDSEIDAMGDLGEAISQTERRAMAAERDSVDRYLAAFLAGRIGHSFKGRISGVTRFGLFVTLMPSGGDGLVPVSTMGSDFYQYEEHQHALVGQRHGQVYRLGDVVDVRLSEAQPISGGLKLELVNEPNRNGKPSSGRPYKKHSAGPHKSGTTPKAGRDKAKRKPGGKGKAKPGRHRKSAR